MITPPLGLVKALLLDSCGSHQTCVLQPWPLRARTKARLGIRAGQLERIPQGFRPGSVLRKTQQTPEDRTPRGVGP